MGRAKRNTKKSIMIMNKHLAQLLRKLQQQRPKQKRGREQKGGAIGAGMALGMMAPMLLGTLDKVLKINV